MLLRKAIFFITIVLTSCAFAQQLQSIPKNAACPPSRIANPNVCRANGGLVQPTLESFKRISKGAQQFALDFVTKISDEFLRYNYNIDFMVSPFSVWSLLLLLTEAAEGKTLTELRSALHVESDSQDALRSAFNEVQNYLQIKTSTIEVASLQALFVDSFDCVDQNYRRIVETCYSGKVEQLRFDQPEFAVQYIKNVVQTSTNKLISYDIPPEELKDAHLLLMSSLYFNGQWKRPFNKSLTRTQPFYDDADNVISNVEMMMQESNFNYTGMNELEGHVLELPYGNEDRLCMLVILPKKGVSTNKVLHNLAKTGIAPIFSKLAEATLGFEDDEVEVYMPKFTTSSDVSLNQVLENMGINNMFDPSTANLTRLSPNLFVAGVIHNTKIIVNEEGTKAAAVTTAVLSNKATPPKFYLNRPFVYLIVEKRSNLLLFAGQVVNPPRV